MRKRGVEAGRIAGVYRPTAFSPRSTMQVDAAFAIKRFCSSVISAFHIADAATALDNRSFCLELCLPDGAKEVDFEFDGCEGFIRCQSTCERNTHCSISDVAKNPTMESAQRICVLRSS